MPLIALTFEVSFLFMIVMKYWIFFHNVFKKELLLTKLPSPLFPSSLLHLACVLLGWSGSGSVIRDHSDHGALNELMKIHVWPKWNHQFLQCTTISIWVILIQITQKNRLLHDSYMQNCKVLSQKGVKYLSTGRL